MRSQRRAIARNKNIGLGGQESIEKARSILEKQNFQVTIHLLVRILIQIRENKPPKNRQSTLAVNSNLLIVKLGNLLKTWIYHNNRII